MLVAAGVAGVVALSAYVAWLDYRVRDEFEGARWAVPARVFARPLELAPGVPLSADAIEEELRLAGYRRVRAAFRPASFERDGGRLRLVTREFRFPDGIVPSRRVTVTVSAGRIAGVEVEGEARAGVRVDPAVIARVFPAHREDRVLLRLDDVPAAFLAILMEVEDRRFYRHVGIDPLAIGRAAWTNLRAGRTVQGGSTLTQQLARNFFLTSERTLTRKANEALVALLLEWRYSKPELLEAYLNEVYLGQQGAHAIHGFGRAAGTTSVAGLPTSTSTRWRSSPVWCAGRHTTTRGAIPSGRCSEGTGSSIASKRRASPVRRRPHVREASRSG